MAPVNEPLSTSILAIMYVGDVVFAVSGALNAARHRMDVLGFVLIGTITGIPIIMARTWGKLTGTLSKNSHLKADDQGTIQRVGRPDVIVNRRVVKRLSRVIRENY